MINILKTCPLCGNDTIRELDMTPEALNEWVGGKHIQTVAPALSDEEREFLICGCCEGCLVDVFDQPEDVIH